MSELLKSVSGDSVKNAVDILKVIHGLEMAITAAISAYVFKKLSDVATSETLQKISDGITARFMRLFPKRKTGGGVVEDFVQFVSDKISKNLEKIVTGELVRYLGDEGRGFVKEMVTDLYRIIMNLIKKKAGGQAPKRRGRQPKKAPSVPVDKRKQRGQLVSKLMKEEGLSLGEASKQALQMMKAN